MQTVSLSPYGLARNIEWNNAKRQGKYICLLASDTPLIKQRGFKREQISEDHIHYFTDGVISNEHQASKQKWNLVKGIVVIFVTALVSAFFASLMTKQADQELIERRGELW